MIAKIKAWLKNCIDRTPEDGALRLLIDSVQVLIRKNLSGVAAQTAFYLLLAVFPMIVLLGAYLAPLHAEIDPEVLAHLFPPSVLSIVESISAHGQPPSTKLKIISIAMSVWSASAAVWALMKGVGAMYGRKPPAWLKGRIASLLVLLLFMAAILLQLALWVFDGRVIGWLAGQGLTDASHWLLDLAGLVMAFLLVFTFSIALYAATPGFKTSARGLVGGATFTAIGWQISTWLFGLYMKTFSRNTALYGGAGAFLGLAMWLLLICMVILLGAGINEALLELDARKSQESSISAGSERSA